MFKPVLKMETYDYSSVLRVPFKILKILGLWQVKSAKRSYKIFGVIYHLIQVELLIFDQLMYAITANNFGEVFEMISVAFTFVGYCVKSWSFIYELENIIVLVDEFKALASLIETIRGKPLTSLKARGLQVEKLFRIFWYFCLITVSLGVFVLVVPIIIDPNPPFKDPYKVWTLVDYHSNIYAVLLIGVLHSINPMIYCGAIAAVEFLPIFFMNSAAGLLDELSEILMEIGTSDQKEKGKQDDDLKQLENCIEIHLRIKTFIWRTEKIFSTTIFVQGALTLLIMCMTSFRISQVTFQSLINQLIKS